jgi:hypothetical protein
LRKKKHTAELTELLALNPFTFDSVMHLWAAPTTDP